VGLLHLFREAEAFQREVAVGHQRFADVVAGELFAFEDDDAAAFLGEMGSGGGAGGSATDDDGIKAGLAHSGFPLLHRFLGARLVLFSGASGVAGVTVFGQEKLVEQAVDLEEAGAGEFDGFGVDLEEAFRFE